jgi:hypothetical protein
MRSSKPAILLMMNKIENILYNIFLVLIGILLIGCLFYIRLQSRQPRDLWQNMSYYQLTLILMIILITLVSIYAQLKNMGVINLKSKGIFLTLAIKYQNFITALKICIIQVYYIVLYILTYIPEKYLGFPTAQLSLLRPVIKVFVNPKGYKIFFACLVIIRILPLTTYLLVFGYEVFISKRLEVSLKIIPILLIILFEKVFIFILSDLYELHKNMFAITKSSKYKHKQSIFYQGRYYSYSRRYSYTKSFGYYFDTYFLILKELKKQLDKYKIQIENILLKGIHLFLTVVRLVIFIYILYYGLK